jgi:hypothetical protein
MNFGAESLEGRSAGIFFGKGLLRNLPVRSFARDVILSGVKMLAILALLFICGCAGGQGTGESRVWRFNFAPQAAPEVKGFININAASVYDPRKGFGWLNATGENRKGAWSDVKGAMWEARENLQLICRPSPDDLARSFACGPAEFAIDLKPGPYEVWILTGDSGLRESIPHSPYRIMVEGAAALDFKPDSADFPKAYETPDWADDLSQDVVWRRHIEPRFRWEKTLVNVQDGQLNLSVDGPTLSAEILDYIGDYALTEWREGPPTRFGGSLNALVVIPRDGNRTDRRMPGEIDAWRRDNFAAKWPMKVPPPAAPRPEATPADERRGYTVFFPAPTAPAFPWDRKTHEEKTLKLRGTPGEYVPITFGLCPLKDLGRTKLWLDGFKRRPDGEAIRLRTGDHLSIGVVKYAARPADNGGAVWLPAPAMIVPTDAWIIQKGVTKQFWLTAALDEDTRPGRYEGTLRLAPENAEETTIKIELEVLPFKLRRPTHLSVGMTYFSPVHYAGFGEERFWKRIEAEFADMRAHNLTCIQFTGLRMDDYGRLGRAFDLYRQAGFENPVYLLESYGAMCRFQREGVAWGSEDFQNRYIQFIRRFVDEAQRRNWPPVIINFGDEFTNRALEEFGSRLAKGLKSIPGVVTGADANGHKEVTLMAPEVDILAFNEGWDGPHGVNRGRRLLTRKTVELIQKAGATPWLVNIGVDRYSNGYWLWKAAQWGVRGKVEWIYRSHNGMPHNHFDAFPLKPHFTYPGPRGATFPSLDYEWMRMGLDDLAYLNTLELAILATRARNEKAAEVAAAEKTLKLLSDSLDADMDRIENGAAVGAVAWPAERFDEARNRLIDHILALQGVQ